MLLDGLTFSPGRPRSPVVPGSVWPLRPCIDNQESDVLSAFSYCFFINKLLIIPFLEYAALPEYVTEWKKGSSSHFVIRAINGDSPALLWVQGVQPQTVTENGENNINYLHSIVLH